MADQGGQTQITDLDELLVKGEDGKFYVLRGETLVPIEEKPTVSVDDVSAFASAAAAVPKPPSPEEFIRDVLRATSVRVSDPVLQTRLEKALTLFFKDLRDRLETKEVLLRSPKIGGAGLTESQVDTLLKAADAKRNSSLQTMQPKPSTPPPVVPTPASRPSVPAAPVLEKAKPTPPVVTEKSGGAGPGSAGKEEIKKFEPPRNLPTVDAVRPSKPVVPPVPQIPRVVPVKPVAPVPPPPPRTPIQEPLPKKEEMVIPKPAGGGRPLIMDVIPPPAKAVGPVDELRYDLLAYRRLGDPRTAANKIIEKVKVLFQSSWKEGMDGVTAWKESPVMHLAFDVIRESMNKGIPVATAIQDALKAGKPMVTMEEWSACIELLERIDALVQGGK